MEGKWRGVVAWAAAVIAASALTIGTSGCSGDASSAAVQTKDPATTFAPLLEFAADEPWRPMSARWFIERSRFWFAEDGDCDDRKIAVGHTLPEEQNPTTDWIFPKGLGGWSWIAYYRTPYGANCETNRADKPVYADQLTRPHDPGPRVEGVRPGQGFYLDLVDTARSGPVMRDGASVPVYVERSDEGDSGVRLTYWILFGMQGRSQQSAAREGDWERVDVILRADGDRYEPQAIQGSGHENETSWRETRLTDKTHPVVMSARATHTMRAAAEGEECADCVPLKAWESLAKVRKELWYGFGGAWGRPGSSDATTGPLGPHGRWRSASEEPPGLSTLLKNRD
jgi:hypothetical protein